MWIVWTLVVLVFFAVVINLVWRWASRKKSLPCPTLLAWFLENPVIQRFNGTRVTLDRMHLRPGQRILEIGPGPGRLLIPAAERVLPGGEAVGIDIQQGMLERLKRRAQKTNVTNLTTILGDATQPHVAEASFDLVVLCTVLGEVPDRPAVLKQAFRASNRAGCCQSPRCSAIRITNRERRCNDSPRRQASDFDQSKARSGSSRPTLSNRDAQFVLLGATASSSIA